MADSIDDARTETERGRMLIGAREFKAAIKRFKEAQRLAETETDKAYALLGDEECQLHLRLPADDESEALEAALALFRAGGDTRAEAWALICLGIRAQSRRDFGGAISYLSEAAALAAEAGEREAAARAFLDMATMLTFRRAPGDIERMESAFSRGYELAASGDAYEKAVSDATRGIVRYAIGDFVGSVQGYRAAASGFSAVGMPEQALETSVALGVALYRSGARDEADVVFRDAAERGVVLSRNVEAGVAFMYLGQLAENSSRYAEAFSRYEEADRRLGPENMYGITLRLGESRALCAMGRYAEAFAKLEDIKGEMSGSTRVGLPMVKASALSGLGLYAEAATNADLSVEEAASRGMAEREADARAVRMSCRHKMGADLLAEVDAQSILDSLSASAASVVKGKALIFLAEAARRKGEFEAALKSARSACELLREVDAPLDLAHALSELGRAALACGDKIEADVALAEACCKALDVRRDAPEAYRRDFLDSIHEIFSGRIEFLIEEGRQEDAYRATLKLLARSMAERFHLSGDEEPPDVGDAAEFVFLPLETSVAIFVRSAYGLAARLARLDQALIRQLRVVGDDAPMSEKKIERGFFLTDPEDNTASGAIGKLADLIAWFKDDIREGGAAFISHASVLYDLFFSPDAGMAEKCRRWIVCPAGILSTFPFEALVDASGSFVLEKREVRYTKTPLIAGDCYRRPDSARRSVLAVGDPLAPVKASLSKETIGKNDTKDAFAFSTFRFIDRGGEVELPPLPGAAREARSACTLPGNNTLLIGAAATKRVFLASLAERSWGILHIAAHALYTEVGREGAILFHPDGDNILSAQEVSAMVIDVDEVILSACASALGKTSWSEGSVGLVDAFIAAGAKNVHATLWSLHDDPTAELMGKVYERYGEGGESFDAVFLRCRRMAARGVFGSGLASPALWAAFVCYGR